MQIVVIEPLGISEEKFNLLASPLQEAGHEVVSYHDRAKNNIELFKRIQDAEIIILANQFLPAEVVEKCSKLKMISVAFTGVDHIPLAVCRKNKIIVCNAAGYSTNAVSELVFGLAINVIRRINLCDERCRHNGTKEGLIGWELYNKTFGVVGTGAIGSRVAQIAKAFGCRVIAYSRSEKENLKAIGVEFVSLDELLKQSDFISLHVPLTSETKRLIDKSAIDKMKRNTILINTARGMVVDNQALAEALNNGTIAGAGIDVFDMEPPLTNDEPLCSAKNTVITPHIAFASQEALTTRAEIVFANISCYLNNRIQNIVK